MHLHRNNLLSHRIINSPSYDEDHLSATPGIDFHDQPQLHQPYPIPHSQLFEELDPNVLLHAETSLLKPSSPHPVSSSWSIFETKK
jgi:hypothetical protein